METTKITHGKGKSFEPSLEDAGGTEVQD